MRTLMDQSLLFEELRLCISQLLKRLHMPVRVAVNGIEGVGKTVFTESLVEYLKLKGLQAIHVSIDGFHFNREHRYRQGRDSARGYYEDSYDESAFVDKVLKACRSEPACITIATHDLDSDEYLNLKPDIIPSDSVIITDGAYLFKPAYRNHWDLKIYLKAGFDVAMERGIRRDETILGGPDEARKKYLNRYHAASRIYIEENKPEDLADIVIDIANFNDIRILKNSTDQ